MNYNIKNGVGKVYYAVITKADEGKTPAEYGEVKELGELIEFNISSETNSVKMYAGNRQIIELEDPSKGNITITVPALSTEAKCDLLGYVKTSEGGIIKAPLTKKQVAIMLEQNSVNSTTKAEITDYITLFKCNVSESDLKGKTKEDSQELQTEQLSIEALTPSNFTDFKYIVSSDGDGFNATNFEKIWGKTVPTTITISASATQSESTASKSK